MDKKKTSAKMGLFSNAGEILRNAMLTRVEWLRSCFDKETKNIDKECGHPVEVAMADYKFAYERGDIAGRIVDVFPEASWQNDPDLFESEDEDETEFEKGWEAIQKEFGIYSLLERADKLSGIGTFGVVLLGIDDGKALIEPVDGLDLTGTKSAKSVGKGPIKNASVKQRKLIYVRPFEESLVTIKTVETDTSNPRFGLPTAYDIQFQDVTNLKVSATVINAKTETVHWTRIIHICDNRVNSDVVGIPRMQRVFNRLLDLKKIMGGSGEMFWRGGFPGYSVETPPGVDPSTISIDTDAAKEQFEEYMQGMKRYLAMVGVTVKSLAPQVADPRNHVEVQCRMIAAAWGIPWRVFMGTEEGQLAGEQDMIAWNKRIKRRQEKYVAPCILIPMVRRLMGMGVLPEVEEVTVEWPDLNTPSDLDKANVSEKKTNALAKYADSGAAHVMPLQKFLTLIMDFTFEEAESIEKEVGDDLEEFLSEPDPMPEDVDKGIAPVAGE